MADPLKYFIKIAQSQGIEVHAWVNVLLSWSRPQKPRSEDHIFNAHPEWFVYDDQGKAFRNMSMSQLNQRTVTGYFVSPAHQEVANLIERYVEEIVTKYEVQGIHLDYIRYPSRGSGLGPAERSLFERIYYVDPLDLVEDRAAMVEKYSESGVEELEDRWVDFRAGLVTGLVRTVRNTIKRSGLDVQLSAAVVADPDTARVHYGQNWAGWLSEGLVDYVAIMNYTPHMDEFVTVVQNAGKRCDPEKILVGVSTYNQSIEHSIREARFALASGFGGICFFSYNDLSKKPVSFDHIRLLQKQ
jgi:uncharacterized lipoprotein YddW (UPF0748 family)